MTTYVFSQHAVNIHLSRVVNQRREISYTFSQSDSPLNLSSFISTLLLSYINKQIVAQEKHLRHRIKSYCYRTYLILYDRHYQTTKHTGD